MRPVLRAFTRTPRPTAHTLPKLRTVRTPHHRSIQLYGLPTFAEPPPTIMSSNSPPAPTAAATTTSETAITSSNAALTQPPPTAQSNLITSFYMRELPRDLLTSYESPDGKRLFAQALNEGHLEAFFPLSQQFLTQNEPAFCGLGTLCMILNALKIDPAVTWRKPWRWFSQEMLDCCRPLEWVKQHGITLAEFSCLAKCNGLEERTMYADTTTFEQFEADVKACASSSERFMAVSYSRASLGQTGSGHFSPVGAYCSANGGMVLILDVARFKYPSYWVPIRALYQALIPRDPSTGQPRGYSILSRPHTPQRPLASMLRLNATPTTWPQIYNPIKTALPAAESFDQLFGTLYTLLRPSPAAPPAVTSRSENKTCGPTDLTPANFTTEGLKAQSEYNRCVDALYGYFAVHCEMWKRVPETEEFRTEVSVFMLALLSLRDVLQRLREEVRREVEERTRADLGNGTINAEVELVRRQMEGLVGCSQVECRSGGTCCRKPKAIE